MSDAQPVTAKWRLKFGGRRLTALIVALVVTSLVATGFVWAHKKVHVIVDGNKKTINTLNTDPVEVLAGAGVYLGPKDEYRMSTPKLVDGAVIEVFRAVPVTVKSKDKADIVITGKPTVGEVASSLGYDLEKIRLLPDPATRPAAGMEIKVIHISEKIVERELPIPYQVVREPDAKLEKGLEQAVSDGEDGLKMAKIRVRYEDGVETAFEILNEKVVKPAVPQVIHVGTRDTVETSRGNLRIKRAMWMEATAYNPTDGAPHGLTATGIPARRGIVAVDPDVIALGTRVYVPGYGMGLAADVGGAIVGNRIDLCMEGYEEAWEFGRRMVKVYILEH